MRANCGRCLACSSLGRSVEVMVVLRREIARQSADLFGKFDQHILEVIALAAGDGRDFDRRAVWQFGFAWQNHHAVFYCAFVTHGTKDSSWQARAPISFSPDSRNKKARLVSQPRCVFVSSELASLSNPFRPCL